ncbi:hypothetical protein OUZ56_028080 [Daphnia magna]|uniref:Transmembrane protein n=1 Tax=Daphnia magna TaxID=35525 RepID=A0A0P5J1V9_9CRUS|nr:hypothetical protein OUZ56_028080 [Daphnia magna]
METPLTAEAGNSGALAAGNSNGVSFDSRRLDDTVNSSSYITVYTNQTLKRLLVLSVSAILCEIIQFICQVCLIMQSRRLSISAISAVLVIWTLLALTLTAQWILLLGSNRVAIVKKGKMLICGCQGLGVLSLLASVALLSVQSEGSKWTEDNTKWLVGAMVGTNCLNVIIFCVLFVFIVRGQKNVHQVIGSWLWLAIQQHIQRQQLLTAESGSDLIKEHLQAAYDAEELSFSAEAA